MAIVARAILSTLVLAGTLAGAMPALAADPAPPTIDRFRAYLIYEDTGELSKNLAATKDQIVANDEKGTSIQMLFDIVLSGKPNQLYESNPQLHVVVKAMAGDPAGTIVDKTYPITFFARDELVRTIVVDHFCNGFDIAASVEDNGKVVSELKKSYSLTCGD